MDEQQRVDRAISPEEASYYFYESLQEHSELWEEFQDVLLGAASEERLREAFVVWYQVFVDSSGDDAFPADEVFPVVLASYKKSAAS